MPYVITTKRPFTRQLVGCHSTSRRAVATLAQARIWVTYRMPAGGPVDLPESGGTVGPLPDGTVIAVERVSYNLLRYESGWTPAPDDEDYSAAHRHGAEVIAAYNARTA